MDKIQQAFLIAELRNHVVACNLAIKREEAGRLAAHFVNAILRERLMEAEKVLKELYEEGNL